MFGFLGRKPSTAPEVERAIEIRDELFAEAEAAMKEVDRVQGRLIGQYERAEQLRRKEAP